MKKAIIIVLVLAAVLFFWKQTGGPTPTPTPETPVVQEGYKNATYQIEGEAITLVNGTAETELAPGSASKLVTTYFGNDVTGDFNADGTEDRAFLLTQTGGGSGTFYYVVAALSGTTGTNAILLGDRIAPQTTEFRDGKIIVNYADRKKDDAMTVQPSVGVSKYILVKDGQLVEVAQ